MFERSTVTSDGMDPSFSMRSMRLWLKSRSRTAALLSWSSCPAAPRIQATRWSEMWVMLSVGGRNEVAAGAAASFIMARQAGLPVFEI